MSYHFMAHTKRMEQAGIFAVRITLGGVDADGNRQMVVSPHETVPAADAVLFPPRVFLIDGTDPLLDVLIEEMAYSEDGPTPEKLQAAIERHPLANAELLEFYADWILDPPDAEEAEPSEPVDEAAVARSLEFVKGLMRGHDAHRKHEARKP